MKRLKILAMAAVLLLGLSSWAGAAVSIQSPFGFWVYDNFGSGGGDGHVNLALDELPLTEDTLILQYGIGSSSWQDFDPNLRDNIPITTSTGQFISFQLLVNGTAFTGTPTLKFIGPDTEGFWNSARLRFGNYEYVFLTTEDGDHVGAKAPTTTPIPAAAWLLGSGLLGLIGIGKRGYFGNA
jgi:hypothetical protein